MKTLKIIARSLFFILVIFGVFKITQFFDNKELQYNLSQKSTLKEIQLLSRLETASFTIEKIIEAGTDTNAFANILFGDKILLIAHANIIAGFDFSKIAEDDVKIEGDTLTINMPAPEILLSRLDNQKTLVYDRKLGLLTKGNSQLESRARLMAEDSIKQAACEGGILDAATSNGRKQITTIFAFAGFKEVILNIPPGNCE